MPILDRSRILSALSVAWVVYAIVWMMREGELRQVVLFGVWTAFMLLAFLYRRVFGESPPAGRTAVFVSAVWGSLLGFGSILATLILMAVKTGLHAHGPEFSPDEIAWLMRQAPLWTLAGLLAGTGLGLLRFALTQRPA